MSIHPLLASGPDLLQHTDRCDGFVKMDFEKIEPLAAFDPAAIPEQPRPPLACKFTPLAPGERISSIELPPRRAPDMGSTSIESLLSRLEQSTMRQRTMLRAG